MLNPEELLAEIVAIPSSSGEEDALVKFLAQRLTAAGLQVQHIGKNLLVDVGGEPGPVMMLASHVDTVAAGNEWNVDPYSSEWKGDKLTALGANDAGASLVAMCCAVEKISRQKFQGTLRLALVVEEETTNAGMAEVLAAVGKPDMAVIGEPTSLEVVRIQSGLAILRATWKGRSCHAAHAARVQNKNAMMQACRELAQLPDYHVFPDRQLGAEQIPPTTLVPAILHAGDRHNRVPDQAIATFDVRLTPPDSAAQIAAWLKLRLPSADVEITSDRLRPMETPNDHKLVIHALQAAERKQAIASSTMSDMALLHGVPAVKCGPGETSRSHTPNEFITRQELLDGVAFYTKLASTLLDVNTCQSSIGAIAQS